MKTNRGFERQDFYDDYGLKCSIQESSAAIPHIWLGVKQAPVKVMRKDLSGVSISLPSPECNECGWCTINLPIDALVESRMHLNRQQALDLSKKLAYFAKHGFLQEDKGRREADDFRLVREAKQRRTIKEWEKKRDGR